MSRITARDRRRGGRGSARNGAEDHARPSRLLGSSELVRPSPRPLERVPDGDVGEVESDRHRREPVVAEDRRHRRQAESPPARAAKKKDPLMSPLLATLRTPADLRSFSLAELDGLAHEVRTRI